MRIKIETEADIQRREEHRIAECDLTYWTDRLRVLQEELVGHSVMSKLKKRRTNWDQVYVCLDTIEDTAQAIQSYQRDTYPRSSGRKYLILYGLMQALVVQQDAVQHLEEGLRLPKTAGRWNQRDPKLERIRNVRNSASGHPTKKWSPRKDGASGDYVYCSITQVSMTQSSFTLITWRDNEAEKIDEVSVSQLIQEQNEILFSELKSAVEYLENAIEKRVGGVVGEQPLKEEFQAWASPLLQELREMQSGDLTDIRFLERMRFLGSFTGRLKGMFQRRGLLFDRAQGLGEFSASFDRVARFAAEVTEELAEGADVCQPGLGSSLGYRILHELVQYRAAGAGDLVRDLRHSGSTEVREILRDVVSDGYDSFYMDELRKGLYAPELVERSIQYLQRLVAGLVGLGPSYEDFATRASELRDSLEQVFLLLQRLHTCTLSELLPSVLDFVEYWMSEIADYLEAVDRDFVSAEGTYADGKREDR